MRPVLVADSKTKNTDEKTTVNNAPKRFRQNSSCW
jgi:hypothetical protein